VTDPGLNFGGGMKRLGIKSTFATKLAKHSVKQRETTVIGGGTNSRFALPSESGSVVERVMVRNNEYVFHKTYKNINNL